MNIKVSYDSHALERQIGRFQRDQIPFASAKALTSTAKLAQKAVQQGLPSHFITRNKWTAGGIKIKPARKQDWPDITAEVGSIDEYMIAQTLGGSRGKGSLFGSRGAIKRASHDPAIPIGIRPNKRRLVSRSKWPNALLHGAQMPMGGRPKGTTNGTHSKPQPFLAVMRSGKTGIFIRTGRGKPQKLKLLYSISKKPINVKKVDWLYTPASKVASDNIQKEFEKSLLEALRTAR